jgi:type III secretion protein W
MSLLNSPLSSPLSTGAQPIATPGSESQVGVMLGQATVQVEGTVSLADSAEEISLHMAETATPRKNSTN